MYDNKNIPYHICTEPHHSLLKINNKNKIKNAILQ